MNDPLIECRMARDEWKVRAIKAEAEVARLSILLRYAQEAIDEEYRLRMEGAVTTAAHPEWYWPCACGLNNAPSVTTCPCGRSKP